MRTWTKVLVWVVLGLFAWVVLFGFAAYGQAVQTEPAPAPARPLPLAVSPQYGEGQTATWWVRSAAPTVVMILGQVLDGGAGCYAALDLVATPPRAYVFDAVTGTWGGAGKLCRVGLERVAVEHGGGMLVRAVFLPAWVGDSVAAGKQTLWLLERDWDGAGEWVRVGVWVVAPDAGGVAWVGGSGAPGVGWVRVPEPEPPPPPPPPAPPQPPSPSPPPVQTTLKRDINDLFLWWGPAGVVFKNGTLQGQGDYTPVPGVGIRTLGAAPWAATDVVHVLGFRFSTFPSVF